MNVSTVLKKLSMAAGAAFIVLGIGTAAQAKQIGLDAFGAGAKVESFENLSVGSNVSNPQSGYLVLGINKPFTFASGVSLTNPIPNSFNQAIVGDWSIGSAAFGLGQNGSINSAADVPDGQAYLELNSRASGGPIEFTFASDMLRVGALVSGAGSGYGSIGGIIKLSAFDAFNKLLETVSIQSVDVSKWSSNFLGVENTSGIRKIAFDGDYVVLDKLTFESAPKSVPEPEESGTTALVFLGIGGFILKKKLAPSSKSQSKI